MAGKLNNSTLTQLPAAVKVPAYQRQERSRGIVHIGPGAFHRAHQAVYTDMAMAFGGNWRITGVSMRSATLKHKMAEQDNLYSLVVLDNEPYVQVIGAFDSVLVLSEDREAIMAALTDTDTHIISLTITEKGYCLNSNGELDTSHPDIMHDLANPDEPVSAIGLIVSALKHRFEQQLSDITVISCDNLADNGKKLGKAVTQFAQKLQPGLAEWVTENICFPCTMVDSITPATDEALIALAADKLGVEDAWPIQREGFTQWVVEDSFSGPRPAWDKVGVTFTDDVAAFENAKLRILNGTHSTLAYTGILLGKETVFEAISDSALASFIRRLLSEEIIPSINAEGVMDLPAYAEDILNRYKNRHIRHLLAQIAWDGSQKLPFRVLNTVRDNLKSGHQAKLLCVPIAAWILFIAKRARDEEQLVDPLADTLSGLAQQHQQDIQALASAVLNLPQVFAELSANKWFKDTVLSYVEVLSGLTQDNAGTVLGEL
ncbi:mannitol dehydrogenase family protein [Alteromonas lipolytica]|uniref:Mannitol dehydrogenase n=1 Tax=Alteromonas lipolytica TaxID=1856405 RepID=A0A1E8FI00_9ALTE|nr:mannitol dehydrogenase family protein [Alteromonas lipolytica]OFI35562.1 mannitol dehydrogenase [Alteromonas lipolytica]GGF77208.1 mannitol 2-dehydrogenase [Alteromonas lipolytica]